MDSQLFLRRTGESLQSEGAAALCAVGIVLSQVGHSNFVDLQTEGKEVEHEGEELNKICTRCGT